MTSDAKLRLIDETISLSEIGVGEWVCSRSVRVVARPCMRAIDSPSHAGYRSLLAPTSTSYSNSLIRLWPQCRFELGGSRLGRGFFVEQTDFLQIRESAGRNARPNSTQGRLFECIRGNWRSANKTEVKSTSTYTNGSS